MRTTKSLVLSAVILTTLIALPCLADVSEATHMLQGDEAYSPIDESQVKVFVFKPDVPLKVIGVIEARGMAESNIFEQMDILSQLGAVLANESYGPGEKEDMALAVRALRREAASIGANGVVIVKQGQVRVSQNATERRIVGAAIRY